MYRDQCSKTLYRTPLQPGWWLEGNQAMKSLKLLMFAALMVAMARALSLIPGIPIAHTKMTWGFLARALCALVCGPVMGLVFGFVEDILGFILQPTGDFFPGYTLSLSLIHIWEVCRAAGEGGAAAFVEVAGTILALAVALPLAEGVRTMMAELLG